MQPNQFILASDSPRRKLLLRNMDISFKIQAPNVIEDDSSYLDPIELVYNNGLLKANAVAKTNPNALVLGSDTTVALEGRIFPKPQDFEKAVEMLMDLSGKWHYVYTSIALLWHAGRFQEIYVDRSRVRLKELSEELILKYYKHVCPLDKAGAYGIQEASEMIIEETQGSIETIMGLPTQLLQKLLKENGFEFKLCD